MNAQRNSCPSRPARALTLACVVITMLLNGQRAAAGVVIDFQSLAVNDAQFHQIGSVYTNQGFVLANFDSGGPASFYVLGMQTYYYANSTTLATAKPNYYPLSYQTDTSLTAINGQAFDLNSIDVSWVCQLTAPTVTFVGSLAGGGVVSTNITLPEWTNLDAHPELFTESLTGFQGLTNVDIISANPGGIQLDNIVLVAVPEPNPCLLIGLGIGTLLGGLRLRRRTS